MNYFKTWFIDFGICIFTKSTKEPKSWYVMLQVTAQT